MSPLRYRPCPVVLAAPSGTGKTTIARDLVEGSEDFVFSVSATTREAREGERDGVDYRFVSRHAFEEMIRREELVEWARVHGNLYGTPRRELSDAEDRGQHVVLDIDVQGARQIRTAVPEAVLIFVFPPSGRALLNRLATRGTEDEDELVRRLRNAREEMTEASVFDYVVVNDDLERAVARVEALVAAESQRPTRIRDLEGDVERLREEISAILLERTRGGAGSPQGKSEE